MMVAVYNFVVLPRGMMADAPTRVSTLSTPPTRSTMLLCGCG